jgi:hypothetical protein
MAIKAALIGMTATQGWHFAKQIATNVVVKAKQDAIDEDDPVKGEILRQRAKALQDGFKVWFDCIEATKGFVAPEEEDNILSGLEFE